MEDIAANVPGLPIGYRFLPSKEDLINHYLVNKNLSKTLPADIIPDIHVNQFYSMPPHQLVADTPCTIDKEWYYFVHDDPYFDGEKKEELIVGNGDGFWRGDGKENPIIDTKDVIGFQMSYIYFAGPIANPEKKEWKLEKYRLPYKCDKASEEQKEGWVMGRIIKGDGYECDI